MTRAKLSRETGIGTTSLQTLEERHQESSKHFRVLARYWGVNEEWLRSGKGPRSGSDETGQTEVTQVGGHLTNPPLNVHEIAEHSSRNLRLDPVKLRAGYALLENFLTAGNRRGVFKAPDDLDLLAAVYDYLRSDGSMDWVDAEIERRLKARGEIHDETAARKLGHKAAGGSSGRKRK